MSGRIRRFGMILALWAVSAAGLRAQTVIDVMIVYDTTAHTWANGNGGMLVFADHAVEKMNLAMANSGVDAVFQLVLATNLNYTYTGDMVDALYGMQGGVGVMEAVHEWRDESGADLVAMFVDTGSMYGYVGLGFLLTSWGGTPDYAYTVNAIRSVNASHTLTHEVGHNLGAHHSKFQSNSPGPNEFLSAPSAPYSAGWYFRGSNGTDYHTIMSYNYDGSKFYQPAPLFSSPLLQYQGTTAGHAQDGDNARLLRETKAIIAAYRDGSNEKPWAPELVSPADMEMVSRTPTLVAGPYYDPDDDPHASTRWQVSVGPDFAALAWDSGMSDGPQTQIQVPFGRLAYNTEYYWRVRYRDGRGGWSPWSETGRFKTEPAPGRSIRITGDLDFGTLATGTSGTRTMTIHNDGTLPLTVREVLYPYAFRGGWSAGVIAPLGSQAVEVVFEPALGGNHGGLITVQCDWTDGDNKKNCTGWANLVETRVMRLAGNLTFGSVEAGRSATRTLMIYNDGNSVMTVGSITYPAGFSGNWAGGLVWANGSRAVTVTFAPPATGSYGGTITVNSDMTSGGSTRDCTGSGTPPGALATGAVQFKMASVWAQEGQVVKLKVARAGGSEGPATVRYKTIARTAQPGVDYIHKTGLLTWSSGDGTTRNIKVRILEDGIAEPVEKFKVKLVSPTGATLGTPIAATVNIAANTKSGPASAGGLSGVTAADGMVWQETTVTGPGALRFDWRVATANPGDTLVFLVNGEALGRIEGLSPWERMYYDFPAGVFTNRWIFIRDPDIKDGAGFVENVTWQ